MTDQFILALNHPQATLERVGGKGASLSRLANAGLPVPDGFTVTTTAYRVFTQQNDLQARILATLGQANPSNPETLDRASSAIAALFAGEAMPADILAAIRRAYAGLPGDEPAVAVRSSATAEDLPEASFAGQQETYLNIRGAQAVMAAVQQCWASLWTARAIGYRLRQGIPPESVALAVVVQRLAPADAAGILFSANPVNGRRDQAMISAAWGLGEAIVGGMVTPDTLTMEKSTGRVLGRETADKRVMTVRTPSGTEEQPTPEALRNAQALSDEQAAQLVRLAVQIETLFQTPVDIEWTLAGETFAIVQARPITALPDVQAEAPDAGTTIEWAMPNPKGLYSRGSLAEHLPNPVSPLFGSLGLRLANQASSEMLKDMYANMPASAEYGYLTINGYTYLSFALNAQTTWAGIKLTIAQTPKILRGSKQRWLNARRELAGHIADWEARPLEKLPAQELLAGVCALTYETMRYYTVIQAGTLPSASISETVLTRLFKFFQREGDPDATVLIMGFDTAALRAEKSLFDLAQTVDAKPGLHTYVSATPSGQLVADLNASRRPDDLFESEWEAWRALLDKHLADFGRTAFDFDFANPTPAEKPETLLEAVKMYLRGQGNNPHLRQREAAERRAALLRQIAVRRGLLPKRWFMKALAWAQDSGPAREDSIADMGMAYPVIRRLLAELGMRLAAGGAITTANDVYWLLEQELGALAIQLTSGDPLSNLDAQVQARRAEHAIRLKAAPPAILPQNSRWARAVPGGRVEISGDTLRGLGTSAGTVTAPACVLVGPEEFGKMNQGDVLVAVTTTPAWTPLFALASAIVTDIGGPLSHSSIVAREYGIPAVMATGVATRSIRSGQTVTVDGRAGLVTIHSGK